LVGRQALDIFAIHSELAAFGQARAEPRGADPATNGSGGHSQQLSGLFGR